MDLLEAPPAQPGDLEFPIKGGMVAESSRVVEAMCRRHRASFTVYTALDGLVRNERKEMEAKGIPAAATADSGNESECLILPKIERNGIDFQVPSGYICRDVVRSTTFERCNLDLLDSDGLMCDEVKVKLHTEATLLAFAELLREV